MNIKLEMSTYQWLKTLCVVSGITTSGCMPEMPVDGGTDTAGEASTDQETTETTGGTAPGGPTSTTETGVDSAGASNSGGDTTGTTGMEETSGVTDTSDSGESTTGDTPPMESCDPLPKYIDLNEIAAGKGGFALISEDDPNDMDLSFSYLGVSVSDAGDVNGDGLADVVVGAPGQSDFPGRAYVVFGKETTEPVDLKKVAQGDGGFVIDQSVGGDDMGWTVSELGDVNGDGLGDIGVRETVNATNSIYVIFGKKNTQPVSTTDILQGTGGFAITENTLQDIVDEEGNYYQWWIGVIAGGGDVNGDGFDDMLVSSSGSKLSDNNFSIALGRTYVIFGQSNISGIQTSDVLQGTGGYVISGQDHDQLGHPGLDIVGDVNGDGFDDIAMAAPNDHFLMDLPYFGRVYVAWGKNDTNHVEASDLAAGIGGIMIEGEDIGAFSTPMMPVGGAGDINHDGYADIIFGSGQLWDQNDGPMSKVYVVLGKEGMTSMQMSDLVQGIGGYAVTDLGGPKSNFGASVNGGGDFNGDGYDDMIIGSLSHKQIDDLLVTSRAYMMYGSADAQGVTLEDLDEGIGGFKMDLNGSGGTRVGVGYSVDLAGDVNGDGYPDWIVGSPGALKDQFDVDLYHPARTYIVFGGCGQPKPG